MSKGWDSATLKKLKALTGRGLSTAEIGKRLGMSKNAIVGKLNRMGWNATAVDTKVVKKTVVKKTVAAKVAPKKAPAKPIAKKVAAKPVVKEVVAKTISKSEIKNQTTKCRGAKSEIVKTKTVSGKNLAMHQRIIQHSMSMAGLKANQCRWPIGDPDSENFHFCGATVFAGKPYCYEHCKQAYQFNPPKKK